jgi:hypothetical protein
LGILPFAGATTIDSRATFVTVRTVEPTIFPTVALMDDVPGLSVLPRPV